MALPELIPLADTVALRKESVDRNSDCRVFADVVAESLSARRAWIEISRRPFVGEELCQVALRKESVDRNSKTWGKTILLVTSLSARRAWIEIYPMRAFEPIGESRSPQGERG